MPYRPYGPPDPLLVGYDPQQELPADHLARLVEQVVEEAVQPPRREVSPGQPPFDPRLCLKVLLYGYATGVRSSRRLERLCRESLPFLFLTRGDTPSYRTLCFARVKYAALFERVWLHLFEVAHAVGMGRIGQIALDSTKVRADASSESVLSAQEYEAVRRRFEQILEEARQVDEQEDEEGGSGDTRLGKAVSRDQVREILRKVRKERRQAQTPPVEEEKPSACAAPEPPRDRITPQLRKRLEAGVEAIRQAQEEGRKHLCLTDPDARMMPEGREGKIRECHSFEVAADKGAGLIVAAQTTQSGVDNERLEALVEAAAEQEPEGVQAVDADSGYYRGDAVGRLIERGIDTCIPDSSTAGDLHRGRPAGTTRDRQRGKVPFSYDAETDTYQCPEGNTLRRTELRHQHGQAVARYRAERDCRACPRAGECLTGRRAARRTLIRGAYQEQLEAALQRFNEPEQRERYRHRGRHIETVFGFLRSVLGYDRWQVRGRERVACEGALWKLAYQLRKAHARWAAA